MSKKATTSAPSAAKAASVVPKDFWGNEIMIGDIIAAPIFMRGFTTYVCRRVRAIDPCGALHVSNMNDVPSKARVINTKRTFKERKN